MNRIEPIIDQTNFFSLRQAKWVLGILNLLIAVVGTETLLGLILRQARSEIASVVKEEDSVAAADEEWYLNN